MGIDRNFVDTGRDFAADDQKSRFLALESARNDKAKTKALSLDCARDDSARFPVSRDDSAWVSAKAGSSRLKALGMTKQKQRRCPSTALGMTVHG